MRKRTVITICICLSVAVIGLLAFTQKSPKQKITKMVHSNIEAYTQAADKAINGEDISEISFTDVRDITVWNNKQVDFLCNSHGLGSATSYYGFYYSYDNVPPTFQGEEVTFTEYGDGLKWEESNGDNWCYIEIIFDNWYYFEMHF